MPVVSDKESIINDNVANLSPSLVGHGTVSKFQVPQS